MRGSKVRNDLVFYLDDVTFSIVILIGDVLIVGLTFEFLIGLGYYEYKTLL